MDTRDCCAPRVRGLCPSACSCVVAVAYSVFCSLSFCTTPTTAVLLAALALQRTVTWGARMQRARREGNPKSHSTSKQGALQFRCNCCSFQSIERDRPTSCDEHARTFTEGGNASHEIETNGQRHPRDGAPSGGSSRWSPTFPRGAQNSGDGAGSSSQRRPPSAGIRTGGDTRRTRRSRGAHTAGHRRRPPPPHLPHTRAGTPARSHTDRGR